MANTYRVGISSAFWPYEVDWIRGGFTTAEEAQEWADENGCYRNVRVEQERETAQKKRANQESAPQMPRAREEAELICQSLSEIDREPYREWLADEISDIQKRTLLAVANEYAHDDFAPDCCVHCYLIKRAKEAGGQPQ